MLRDGRVVATGSPPELIAEHAGATRVRFSIDDNEVLDWLTIVAGVESISRSGREVTVDGRGPLLAYTAAALVEHGIAPLDLRTERRTLEDAFLEISGVGNGLREDGGTG